MRQWPCQVSWVCLSCHVMPQCREVVLSPPVGASGLDRFHVFECAAHIVACDGSQAMLEGVCAGDASAP